MIILNEDEREIKIHSYDNVFTNVIVDVSQQKHQEQNDIEIMFNDMRIKGIHTMFLDYSNNDILEQIKISKKQVNPLQIQFENKLKLKENRTQHNIYKKTEFICGDNQYHKNLRNNLKIILSSVKQKKELYDMVQKFFPDIQEILIIENRIVVQKKSLDGMINSKLMGAGFQKIIAIILSVLTGKKYILIDEIENGLHFEHIDLLFESILAFKEVQFFITTHNKEILKRLSRLLSQKDKEILCGFNIYEDDCQKIKVGFYSQEDFISNMKNNNEIRD
ncbi:AAA family ATPase [uncultured Helicobacter sp.]|uniref:AAA family ATPase n=1 Tax=uncultured Helicobacter sp. TaxID=175537 RepID=UPI0026357B99|nr:AAA family ATPase [uncultured Helicobacter sp.]